MSSALDVLSLAAVKEHLNIDLDDRVHDAELLGLIPAAVGRVRAHIRRSFTSPDEATASERGEMRAASELLACKMVLADYWRTQIFSGRTEIYGTSPAVVEMDVGPAGASSLTMRLTDLLGPPGAEADDDGRSARVPAPQGSFPAAHPWPDPVYVQDGQAPW